MKPALIAALLALLVLAPAALAVFEKPIPAIGALPSAAEQERAVSAALRQGRPVYCGGGQGNAVALTFDDGPGPYTGRILSELHAAHAHATFFLVGNRLQYWPEAPREEERVGSLGNHTWSHPPLTKRRSWVVWLELLRTQYAVAQDVGWKPRLFRVPYALHSASVDGIAQRLGLLEVFWDVDGRDDVPDAKVADIVRNVRRGLRPGAIVELHDLHAWTAAALPQILAAIAARGLRAVSVPELLALDPPAPHQGCPYAPVGE
ncbi:MAG TPA: polysaccharide deacetylase family protein [Gaiellaceae bacterium]|jgi:peptidoglycan/xylan/chitin deacetylase (PgdA/CDA1 family)|nr:polysaccharide deacetylase family protein [Gaiellaceae bacterium]